MMNRRDLLLSAAVSGHSMVHGGALIATQASSASIPAEESLLDQIRQDLLFLDAQLHLQTGGAGELALADRVEAQLESAGFRTASQTVTAPLASVAAAHIEWPGGRAEVWPQRPLRFTGPHGLSRPLSIWRGGSEAPIERGTIVLASLPYARHSQLIASLPLVDLRLLAEHGAEAVIIVTDGPTGEAIALNCPPDISGFPPLPLVVMGPKQASPLFDLAARGAPIRLLLTGEVGAGRSRNIWGETGRDGPLVVVSTPRTGWTSAVAERGPGLATFHALARWLPRAFPNHRFLFVNTCAHEYDNAGSRAFLSSHAPRPADVTLWLHLGAGFAARDFHELGKYQLAPLQTPDVQRFLVGTEDLVPMLAPAFANEPGLSQVYPASAGAVGELDEVLRAGYPRVFGLLAGHRHHHVATDRFDKTEPAFVARVVLALQSALRAILGTAALGPS